MSATFVALSVAATLMLPAVASERVNAPTPYPRLVVAMYYPWYRLEDVSGKRSHVGMVDPAKLSISDFARYPTSGAYDSTDGRVIQRHFQLLKAAGVDAIACSWWGPDDFTHSALKVLLPFARQQHIQLCLYIERVNQSEPKAVSDEILAALEGVGENPAYLKVNGKPVVFLYAAALDRLDMERWREVVECLKTRVFFVAEGATIDRADAFDGLHLNNPALSLAGLPHEQVVLSNRMFQEMLVQAARAKRRLAVATVFPGFNNRKVASPGFFIDRWQGRLYADIWESVLELEPDWVFIRSFNQWHDGTEIEPSLEYGQRYMALTAEYVSRFRRLAGSPTR
jgi:glycoprotein endo-alpha-1,2-mannosidase